MADASAITVLLVTTGSTPWEDDGRLCGATDQAMSDHGREDFTNALDLLSGEKLDIVYCSPDEGSVEAAESRRQAIQRSQTGRGIAQRGRVGSLGGPETRGSRHTPCQGIQAMVRRPRQRGPPRR